MCETNCTHTKPKLFSSLVEKERVIHDKWKDEASKTNFEIVGPPKRISYPASQNYLEYKCKTCGHLEDFQITHIRRNHVRCSVCQEVEFAKLAEARGMEIIGPSDKGIGWRKLRIKECGHEGEWRIQVFHAEGVRDKCVECFNEKCRTVAESVDMTFIGKSDVGGAYRQFKYNACGHMKDTTVTVLMNGNHSCKECIINGDTAGPEHYRKPSYIYLFKFEYDGFAWLKLGYSKNTLVRKNNYGVPEGTEFELLANIAFETGAKAQKEELKLHRKIKHLKLTKKEMSEYMRINGYSECYPVSLQEFILSELERLVE